MLMTVSLSFQTFWGGPRVHSSGCCQIPGNSPRVPLLGEVALVAFFVNPSFYSSAYSAAELRCTGYRYTIHWLLHGFKIFLVKTVQ